MPIERGEARMRELVDGIRERLDVATVSDAESIRAEALEMFTKQLDGKIANLQDGETLQVTFRVDIVGAENKIRGGSGAERNMPEYVAWRNQVFERDNYTCQECGQRGNVQAHHVKHWSHHPESRFDVSNGVTLCVECHANKHPHMRHV